MPPNPPDSETPPVKQIRNIQVLRGAAAILVIYYHAHLWEGKTFATHAVSPAIAAHGLIGVDLFFVISGFIMAYIQPRPLDTVQSYARFLVHRFTRIYPPLWIALLILLPVYIFRPDLINASNHHQVDLLRSFLLLPQDHLPLLQVAWTLIHEVHFYVVVSFALIFRPPGRALFGALWFLIVFTIYYLFGRTDFAENRWLELIFSPFSLTFLLGYFIGLWYSSRPAAGVTLGLLCLLLAIGGAALAVRFMPEDGYYPHTNSLYRFFYYGIPCALTLLAALLLEPATRRRFASLRHLGDESYSLYLLHLPVLATLFKIVGAFHSTNPILLGATFLIAPLPCIAIAIPFHRHIELKVTRLARQSLENWLHL